uniref:Pentatricopeptide repeat-containing protein n=1 Tax=Brassica oleracea var. oleracea TaxID=109376 RepID=A0A0D3ACF6_BRAOL
MFDKMPERNVYSWNAVISAIVKLEVHFLNVRLSTGRPNKWVCLVGHIFF